MFVNSDFTDLLRLFNDYHIKYLVIGGYAIIQYAEPRFTKDLDLWISTKTDNAAAVYKALKSFGAPLVGMTEADFSEEGYFYQLYGVICNRPREAQYFLGDGITGDNWFVSSQIGDC